MLHIATHGFFIPTEEEYKNDRWQFQLTGDQQPTAVQTNPMLRSGLVLGRGLTLVVVTHDPGVARRADRVLILVDGRIVMRVPGSEIRQAMELLADENGDPGDE